MDGNGMGERVATLEARDVSTDERLARLEANMEKLLTLAQTGSGLFHLFLKLGGLVAAIAAAIHYGIADYRGR